MTRLFKKALTTFEKEYGKKFELREVYIEDWVKDEYGYRASFRVEAVSKETGKYETIIIYTESK